MQLHEAVFTVTADLLFILKGCIVFSSLYPLTLFLYFCQHIYSADLTCYWLPVKPRIKFKILSYKVLNNPSLSSLKDLTVPYHPNRALCSHNAGHPASFKGRMGVRINLFDRGGSGDPESTFWHAEIGLGCFPWFTDCFLFYFYLFYFESGATY